MSAVQVREELVSLLSDVAARSPDFEHQRHISDDVIARFRKWAYTAHWCRKCTAG
jgi:hypothetical protein